MKFKLPLSSDIRSYKQEDDEVANNHVRSPVAPKTKEEN